MSSARRIRVLLHVAPAAIGFLCPVWVYSVWEASGAGVARLNRVALALALLAFAGGVGACWLPARGRYRVLLIVLSFAAAVVAMGSLRLTS